MDDREWEVMMIASEKWRAQVISSDNLRLIPERREAEVVAALSFMDAVRDGTAIVKAVDMERGACPRR